MASKGDVSLKHAVIAAAIAATTTASTASAVTPTCKWAVSEIPVYVNVQSFEDLGIGARRAEQAVLNAMLVWSSEGQSNVRLKYGGTTSAVSGQPGRINIFAQNLGGGCTLAITSWSNSGGVCDAPSIGVYVRSGIACQHQPIDWMADGPTINFVHLSDTIVHELGHAILGATDDYANPLTVMQASSWNAQSHHLYNADIDMLQLGAFPYGVRTSYTLKKISSSDVAVWSSPISIGTTNVRAGIAGSATDLRVAYVDSGVAGGPITVKKSTDGITWTADTVTSSSRIGVDLARSANAYVLAFVDSGTGRGIRTKRHSAGVWLADIAVAGASSNVPPSVVWNSNQSKLLLFFVEPSTHRLRYVVSTDEAITWTAPLYVASDSQREFMALDGPSASCDGNNQCFLTWPAFSLYLGAAQSVCTAKFSLSAMNQIVVGDRSCQLTDTGDTTGVAFGSNGSFTGWLLGRTGRDANQSLAFGKKTTFDVGGEWLNAGASTQRSRVGVSVAFVPKTNKWELLYAGD